jgi:hypothetical protein
MKNLLTIIAVLFCQMAFCQAPFFNGTVPKNSPDIAFTDLVVSKTIPKIKGKIITLQKRIGCTDIGNASARGFKVIVLLPGEAEINSYSVSNTSLGKVVKVNRYWTPHPTNPNSITGYLEIEVVGGFLDRCEHFDLTVKTSLSKSEANNYGNFAVFAYSLTPECKPQDNYWFWKSQPNVNSCNKKALPKKEKSI